MLSHTMVGSSNVDQAKRFYDKVLGTLGAGEGAVFKVASGHTRIAYPHDGSLFIIAEPLNNEPATSANGATVGFKCNSPEQVQQFHDVAVEAGGTSIEDPPGLRDGPMGPMHLAYVRDLDGNKLCAIHRPE